MKRRAALAPMQSTIGKKDRARFTAAERASFIKYQETPADLPAGWLTHHEYALTAGAMATEADLVDIPSAVWGVVFENLRSRRPELFGATDLRCSPVVLPLMLGTVDAIGYVDPDTHDCASVRQMVQEIQDAIEVTWLDPEPPETLEVNVTDEATIDVAGLVREAREVIAEQVARRGTPTTLDEYYRQQIDFAGRAYAEKEIKLLRTCGALGPRPVLKCTTGQTMLLDQAGYERLASETTFSCANPDCGSGCAVVMSSWSQLVEDDLVADGKTLAHTRTEQTRDGRWGLVVFHGNPARPEAIKQHMAHRDHEYNFKVSAEARP